MKFFENLIDIVKRVAARVILPGGVAGVIAVAALSAHADLPAIAVAPRNTIMLTNWQVPVTITNGQSTNIGTYAPIVLTPSFQHYLTVTTILGATNAGAGGTNTVGSGAAGYTNYFDLGKIWTSNSVSVTNWTTDTPIQVTGNINGLAPVCQARTINPTNFDGYDLIRFTKFAPGWTNQYWLQVILSQTP
jgi:hypothetical protein